MKNLTLITLLTFSCIGCKSSKIAQLETGNAQLKNKWTV